MLLRVALATVICTLIAFTHAQCSGSVNSNPVYTDNPTLVRSTTNGKLYLAGAPGSQVYIAHLYGSPYQMGYAHGQLFKQELSKIMGEVFAYLDDQADEILKKLPKDLREFVAKYGVEAALQLTHMLTKPYTPDYFYDEIRGIADGSGYSYDKLVWVQMLPELIKAQCTIVGAWGSATTLSVNGSLVQLRALDWATDGPFQQYPVVWVYHPSGPQGIGHPFASMSWVGFIGAITGFSSAPMGLSQKVMMQPDEYNGTSSRAGIPFHFLLRDILQFDGDVETAISRMANAHRTCSVYVGLGDGRNEFRVITYTYDGLGIYDDVNYPVTANHPIIPGVMYIDKGEQPSGDACLPSLLQQYHGRLDAATFYHNITALFQTGNMHIAIYDYATWTMYVANASPGPNVVNAYDRPFTRLDMRALFAQSL